MYQIKCDNISGLKFDSASVLMYKASDCIIDSSGFLKLQSALWLVD